MSQYILACGKIEVLSVDSVPRAKCFSTNGVVPRAKFVDADIVHSDVYILKNLLHICYYVKRIAQVTHEDTFIILRMF